MELFCISKLINCVLETDEEFVCMDFHFAVRSGAGSRVHAVGDVDQVEGTGSAQFAPYPVPLVLLEPAFC